MTKARYFCYAFTMRKIEGKVIVITGGSGGIGKALKARLSENNTVIDFSRSNDNTDNDFRVDVSDENAVRDAFLIIKEKYGRVDILINNAGYGLSGAVELLDEGAVRKLFEVDFFGAFYCAKQALPLMEKGGKIINVSSACAIFPLPFRTMYCAVKSALSMFSYGLRAEVAPCGIDVTAVCPGDTKTGFTKNRDKHFDTNDRYGNRIKSADDHISEREEKRMSVDYVADKLYKITAKKRFKAMYLIGRKYKFLYALYRIFPLNLIISASGGMFGGKNEEK